METSEASNEDIENENMNGDSNLEPVDIHKTVTDFNDKSDINCDEELNVDKRTALKRKAEDDRVEQTEKIMKIENSDILEPLCENRDNKSKNDEDFDDQSSGDEPKLTIKIEDDNTSEKLKNEEDDEDNTSQKSEHTPQSLANNQKMDDQKNQDHESSKTKLTRPTQIFATEATRQSVRANRNSNPAAFLIKKPKPPTDMSNPAYRKPFLYGWKRELVYRANSESGPKRNGDIYYFTPDGKKVRSMREVLENLKTKELSTENFTFYKEPLGMNDPELEIIRVAKVKGSAPPASFSTHKKFLKAKKEQKLLEKSVVSNNKSKSTKFGSGLKIKLSGARLSQSKKSSSKSEKRNKSSKVGLQIGMLPPGWQSSQKKREKLLDSVPEKVIKLTEQCSVHCEGVAPAIPNLQCSLCLCLYHPECVGFTVQNADCHENYVCKNCQPEDDTPLKDGKQTTEADSSLPPLTPFNAIKTHAPVSTVPPRLHRINHTADSAREQIKKSARHSKLLTSQQTKPNETTQNHTSGSTHVETTKSLVGSVTTWLHSSSTVQMVQSNNDSVASLTNNESSQFQAIITGRKFIVIPKQNVLSIHPNEQTTNNSVQPVDNPHSVPPSQSSIPSDTTPSLPVPLAPSIPDNIAPGAPLPYNSQIITITTNNAHTQATQPVEASSLVTSNSPTTMEHHVRTQWQTDGSLKQTSTPSVKPGKISSTRNKKNSQRSSTASTNSIIEKLEKSKLDTREKEKYMQNFLHHVSVGYSVLLQVFQYLKVQELLRASRVCRMWRDLANHPSLWRTVRMKNSQVRDWKGFVKSLKRHETEILDLRKVLLPGSGDDMWSAFTTELGNADTLKRIDLCRCPATVVEELANSNQNLEVINAISIRCTSVNLSSYEKLKNLRELRLKSQNGVELTNTFSFLEHLKCLKHLSLLSFKDLGKKNVESIAKLIDLESLELGECDSLIDTFGSDVISKLEKIEKLRLEKGPSGTSTYNILEAISKLPKIYQIELVNFDVKTGFDEALALCTNIKRLLLIPTYISQSATTNNMVLNGIFQLADNLQYFIWGVTLELLRVTELFIDQCDQTPKKKQSPKKDKKGTGAGDSIPILKPVPSVENFKGGGASTGASDITQDNTQVEILPLNALQKLLTNKLQNTKIKILKIPYHATWRQNINDTIQ